MAARSEKRTLLPKENDLPKSAGHHSDDQAEESLKALSPYPPGTLVSRVAFRTEGISSEYRMAALTRQLSAAAASGNAQATGRRTLNMMAALFDIELRQALSVCGVAVTEACLLKPSYLGSGGGVRAMVAGGKLVAVEGQKVAAGSSCCADLCCEEGEEEACLPLLLFPDEW